MLHSQRSFVRFQNNNSRMLLVKFSHGARYRYEFFSLIFRFQKEKNEKIKMIINKFFALSRSSPFGFRGRLREIYFKVFFSGVSLTFLTHVYEMKKVFVDTLFVVEK